MDNLWRLTQDPAKFHVCLVGIRVRGCHICCSTIFRDNYLLYDHNDCNSDTAKVVGYPVLFWSKDIRTSQTLEQHSSGKTTERISNLRIFRQPFLEAVLQHWLNTLMVQLRVRSSVASIGTPETTALLPQVYLKKRENFIGMNVVPSFKISHWDSPLVCCVHMWYSGLRREAPEFLVHLLL